MVCLLISTFRLQKIWCVCFFVSFHFLFILFSVCVDHCNFIFHSLIFIHLFHYSIRVFTCAMHGFFFLFNSHYKFCFVLHFCCLLLLRISNRIWCMYMCNIHFWYYYHHILLLFFSDGIFLFVPLTFYVYYQFHFCAELDFIIEFSIYFVYLPFDDWHFCVFISASRNVFKQKKKKKNIGIECTNIYSIDRLGKIAFISFSFMMCVFSFFFSRCLCCCSCWVHSFFNSCVSFKCILLTSIIELLSKTHIENELL